MSIKTDARVEALEKELQAMKRDLKSLTEAVASLVSKGRKRGSNE
jgi:predicted  nucleic acid-binding Zn-ribbon protein